MVNIVRHKHRLAGGGGAGSPATVDPSGVISINFDTGTTPELWASDGSAWYALNPATVWATAAEVVAGTVAGKSIDPLTLAAASVAGTTAGLADAGKQVKLDATGYISRDLFDSTSAIAVSAGAGDADKIVLTDANGLIDSSLFDTATGAEIIAGTAGAGLVDVDGLAAASTDTSAGAADAGKFVQLDANGALDTSLFGASAVDSSTGVAEAGKLVKLDANGLIDASMYDEATSAEIIAGTADTGVLTPDQMAGAATDVSAGAADAAKYVRLDANGLVDGSMLDSTTTSAGAGDAGKIVELDANGLIDASMYTEATAADIIAGTADTGIVTADALSAAATDASTGVADAGKFVQLDAAGELDPSLFGTNVVDASTGAADAGKLIKTDAAGLLDISFVDEATAAEIAANAGSGTVNGLVTDDKLAAASVDGSVAPVAGDVGKYVRVGADGKIDAALINIPTDVMEYKGGVDVTGAAPATPNKGDVYTVTTGGTIDASFTGIAGDESEIGDQVIFDGTNWVLVDSASPDLAGYLPLAGTAGVTGTAMASGALVTFDPATNKDVVINGSTAAGTYGSIDRCEIDCGTF